MVMANLGYGLLILNIGVSCFLFFLTRHTSTQEEVATGGSSPRIHYSTRLWMSGFVLLSLVAFESAFVSFGGTVASASVAFVSFAIVICLLALIIAFIRRSHERRYIEIGSIVLLLPIAYVDYRQIVLWSLFLIGAGSVAFIGMITLLIDATRFRNGTQRRL